MKKKNYTSPLSKLINNFEGLQKIYFINFLWSSKRVKYINIDINAVKNMRLIVSSYIKNNKNVLLM